MLKPRLFSGLLMAGGLWAGAAWAGPDQVFLKKALEGDNSEMTLGQMAVDHGASTGVRDFGRMLHDDHAAAKSKVLAVAKTHGVPDTQEIAPEAKAEARKLEALSGPEFDREFARYMVGDHRKDIADFQKQARRGDRQTAALARETLPDLRRHLKVAEGLTVRR